MKEVLYTNGDRALFADYAGSMFVGLHGEIDTLYKIRASFSCKNNPFAKTQERPARDFQPGLSFPPLNHEEEYGD